MTEQIYAFGSTDLQVQFWYGLEKENSIICPVARFNAVKTVTGEIDGIFELGTILYNDYEYDVFEDREDLSNVIGSSEMDIVVFPKKCIQPLMRCDGVRITSKNLNIVAPSNPVYIQYLFSNRSDWELHKVELPKRSAFNPDPLYRMARALDDIKKSLEVSGERNSSDNITMSVEEYTDLKLNGKVPKRYANFEE